MDKLRSDPRVVAFMQAAESFCKLLDEMPSNWKVRVLEQLPKLYVAAQDLPELSEYEITTSDSPVSEFGMTHEEWSLLWNKLGRSLGESRFYWKVFDFAEHVPDEPVCGDIADDLADIYRDVKGGLDAWNSGNDEFVPDILHEVRQFGFALHWGPHLLSALRPLHRLIYENES